MAPSGEGPIRRCTRHLIPGILDRMACGVALALAIGGVFVGIYGVSCMWCYKNTVKYSISDMLCCQSVANSGVLATLAFLAVAKTS